MEDILELVFTITAEIVDVVKFKNPKTRTWVMTILHGLCFAIVTGTAAVGAIALYKQDNLLGVSVVGGLAVAALIVAVIVLVKGHRSNWQRR